jgi:polyhydroxybutyrate depolymerase
MNGTEDPIIPWHGGTMKLWRKTMGEVVSTQKTIDFWVDHNKCRKIPVITQLPNTNKHDNSTVKLSNYTKCKNHSSVQLYTIEGGGHTMPSKKGFNMPRLVGEKNRDIEGIKVIVDFLLKH